ncbi:MAG: histidine triad nucleotide-binding protein [Proteobacteria bacterium]|nr:histidine triad nucleotide-binding protein [Pseudomonadota bacterium]
MSKECVFCKIINRELPANLVYEDDQVVAFPDIHPKAPHHLLIIPKRHIATLNDITEQDTALAGHLLQVAKKLAVQLAIAEQGYRVLMNCNEGGGQAVFHIHLHLLGGRMMHWPPG